MATVPIADKSLKSINKVARAPAKPATKKRAEADGPERRLGRWTLLKPLARGGMGEVYLASSGGIEGAERPCVVKLIRREHLKDKSFLARFFDEARVQAQLQHPGVAQVLEASTDPSGKPYVVLEHVEGRNLSEVQKRALQLNVIVSWADAVAVAVCLAEALMHVHERKDPSGRELAIVHRDLSPQNVMVGYAGDVKLIDFGTARGKNRRCQTVSGIVFAKPGYVAPEVANQTPGGVQADLYALGVMLWELAIGRRFLSGEPNEHLAQVASGNKHPAPLSLTMSVPLELDTIIARLTAPDLTERYPTAREALGDLVRTLKRAPSLADGERSVRSRIAHLMTRLYPAEPARTRQEFAALVTDVRKLDPKPEVVTSTPESDSAKPDSMLSGTRYRLDEKLAEGPMSVVYAATHVDLARRVALKVLPKEHCDNPKFEARFRREARALAQLRHHHLVHLHDFGVSHDGRPFYAMELLEGETLEQRLKRERLTWREAFSLGKELCRALTAAHALGLVHRDVKPSNIFLTLQGSAKLLDFGIAQNETETEKDEASGALRLTGTVEYMAPEQIGKGDVDERADIYGLCSVLYELITGAQPHQADNVVALLDLKQRDMPAPPRTLCVDRSLPKQIDRILLRGLAPNPKDRYPSAEELGLSLGDALLAPERRQRRRRQLASVALGVGLVGTGVLSLTGPGTAAHGFSWDAFSAPAADTQANLAVTIPETRFGAPLDLTPVDLTPVGTVTPDPRKAATDNSKRTTPAVDPHPSGVDPREAKPAEPIASASQTKVEPSDEPGGKQQAEFPQQQLERAERLRRGGRAEHLRALALFRELGALHPKHPDVLAGWSKVAARTKWWGESLRVAIRWAAADPTPPAQIHLARTQRLVGQRFGAIQTLERLLEQAPKHPEALATLARYRGR